MSHKATTWLSGLDAFQTTNSEFRVLFHLCDCHNPSQGCFPTQGYLLGVTGVSNGTLNNALNSLEAKGLIRRHQERDGRTKRQLPTRYILGFEMTKPQDPTPETGDGNSPKPSPKTGAGNSPKPSPKTGDGAVSKKHPEPSPKNGKSRLQPTGEEPVIEPVINPDVPPVLANLATDLRAGRYVPASAMSPIQARLILDAGMVTPDLLRKAGIAF